MTTASFTATALRMSAPVIVWAAHFFAIYGVTGIACARGAPQAALVAVAVATPLALALLLAIALRDWRRRQQFESWFTLAAAGFASVAVAWEALPALWVSPCG